MTTATPMNARARRQEELLWQRALRRLAPPQPAAATQTPPRQRDSRAAARTRPQAAGAAGPA
ncbi:hypothetical protein [Ferrovibrio sp.]|uniref:hypothetical protein n=1 Tax=Ferrovibrio sp. TaxID=1917215 RepID=UPI00351713C7